MAIKAVSSCWPTSALAACAVGGPGRTGPGTAPAATPDALASPLVIIYRAGTPLTDEVLTEPTQKPLVASLGDCANDPGDVLRGDDRKESKPNE